jgi:type II secretory pathway pseudopilin PulG
MTKQSGNMLFILLVCIALLGGLAALLTRSGSSSDDTGDAEQTSIRASDILKYSAALQTAVATLQTKGCSENEISFWVDHNNDGIENASDKNYNPTSPTNRRCHVFHAAGAGLRYKKDTEFFKSFSAPYNDFIAHTAFPDVGTNAAEVYWMLELPLNNLELCKRLNALSGLEDTTPLVTSVSAGLIYTGTFSTPHAMVAPSLSGQKSFCISYSATPSRYHFASVLITR